MQAQLTVHQAQQKKTADTLEHSPIPEIASTHRPVPFHGYDSEDVNRWLDKLEYYLKLRRIDVGSPTALAELVLNLAGPQKISFIPCQTTARKHGRTGHLQARCPERRNAAIRSQTPQSRQQGVNYSLNHGYNQPRDNYQSFPQQGRRDQRIAMLDEGLYDDEFVAPLQRGPLAKTYFCPGLEWPDGCEEQPTVEMLSTDTVEFSKPKFHDVINSHGNLSSHHKWTLPSTNHNACYQSLTALPEIEPQPQPELAFLFHPEVRPLPEVVFTDSRQVCNQAPPPPPQIHW